VVMPDVSGPELATALKQQRPEMRVLLPSGFADGAMLILNHGWRFIAKPFLASALLQE
jgi:FixJ family two-component response regulator